MAGIGLGFVASGASKALGLTIFESFVLGTSAGIFGSIIDQKVTNPLLFGKDRPVTPNLPDVQTGDDGSPGNICVGRTCISTGTVIWRGQRRVNQRSNGTIEIDDEFAVAISFTEQTRLLKVWAQGDALLNNDPKDVQTVVATIYGEVGLNTIRNVYLIEAPVKNVFQVGDSIKVDGAATPQYNKVASTITGVRAFSSGRLMITTFGPANLGQETLVTITIQKVHSSGSTLRTADIVFYPGNHTQGVDPLILAKEGANAPAFRGTCYVRISRMRTERYGGLIPQSMKFLTEQSPTCTLGDAVEVLMLAGGYQASQFDKSDLDSIDFAGITIPGPWNLKSTLPFLESAYDFSSVRDWDKIIFRRNSESAVRVIPEDDLAIHDFGSEVSGNPVQFSPVADLKIPTKLVLRYLDPFLDYQVGTVTEESEAISFNNVEDLQIPLVLTESQAKQLSQRLFWKYYNERVHANFIVGPEHMDLEPTDVIQFTVGTEAFKARIEHTILGANGLSELRTVIMDSDTAVQTSVDDSERTFNSSEPEPVQPLMIELLDIAPVFDQHVEDPILHCAVRSFDDSVFRGALVYRSFDGVNWKALAALGNDHFMGEAVTVLPTTANFYTFDYTNTVDVFLPGNQTLIAVTKDEIIAERTNMAILGDEIFYFQTPTLVSANTWRLSGLLRGQRNTEEHVGSHAVGERFILLNSTAVDDVGVIPMSFSDVNRNQYFSIVGVNGSPGDTPEISIQPLMRSIRPFSVADVMVTYDGSNNATFTWSRRDRSFGMELKDGGTTLTGNVELYYFYLIDKTPGNPSLLLRVDEPQAVVDAATLASYGYTPIEPVDIQIQQWSTTYGLGNKFRGLV